MLILMIDKAVVMAYLLNEQAGLMRGMEFVAAL
jgi:hypothetical protein